MNKKKNSAARNPRWLPPVLGGVLCAALTGAAVWFDLTYNGGRLVYPMDSYAFRTTDIPSLLAIALGVVYILYLFVLLIGGICAQRKRVETTNRTRKLNPKLGFLGILGLAGLLGFYTYPAFHVYFPFCFFGFFGFFGFFFEGKMSDTLMDERFRENASRAERQAYRTGFIIIFLLLVIVGQGRASAELVLPMLMIGIALALALTLFLSEYLLYRYDHDDATALEEEE